MTDLLSLASGPEDGDVWIRSWSSPASTALRFLTTILTFSENFRWQLSQRSKSLLEYPQ